MTTLTNYRALCAELADELQAWMETAERLGFVDGEVTEGADRLLTRARALLAHPAPVVVEVTDEELLALRSWSSHGPTFDSDLVDFARAVLARYGTAFFESNVVKKPSTKELFDLWSVCNSPSVFARAVLARYGTASNVVKATDEEIEVGFRAWWKDRHGSPYFGAVPLVECIAWTQHVMSSDAHPEPVSVPHPDDEAVDRFAAAMKAKLAKKRKEGRSGWQTASAEFLTQLLRGHLTKGDPVDVGNFAMMLHQNGESIVELKPIPITERLPQPWECSPSGYFWVWTEDDGKWEWMHVGEMNWQYREHHGYTHWAPYWALPRA